MAEEFLSKDIQTKRDELLSKYANMQDRIQAMANRLVHDKKAILWDNPEGRYAVKSEGKHKIVLVAKVQDLETGEKETYFYRAYSPRHWEIEYKPENFIYDSINEDYHRKNYDILFLIQCKVFNMQMTEQAKKWVDKDLSFPIIRNRKRGSK